MTNQVETKQVTWEDLEVAEEQKTLSLEERAEELLKQSSLERQRTISGNPRLPEITEWKEGNEPIPEHQPSLKGVLILQCAVDMKAFEEAVMARMLVEEARNQTFVQVANAYRIPPSELQDRNLSHEDMERMHRWTGYLSDTHSMSAFCTPSRNLITGNWGVPSVLNSE